MPMKKVGSEMPISEIVRNALVRSRVGCSAVYTPIGMPSQQRIEGGDEDSAPASPAGVRAISSATGRSMA